MWTKVDSHGFVLRRCDIDRRLLVETLRWSCNGLPPPWPAPPTSGTASVVTEDIPGTTLFGVPENDELAKQRAVDTKTKAVAAALSPFVSGVAEGGTLRFRDPMATHRVHVARERKAASYDSSPEANALRELSKRAGSAKFEPDIGNSVAFALRDSVLDLEGAEQLSPRAVTHVLRELGFLKIGTEDALELAVERIKALFKRARKREQELCEEDRVPRANRARRYKRRRQTPPLVANPSPFDIITGS